MTKKKKNGIFTIMRVGYSSAGGQGIGAALILVLALALLACSSRDEEVQIALPASPLLSRDFIGYGVIIVSYTHVLDRPQSDASSQGYVRRASIVKVLERRLVRESGESASWVYIEGDYQGWLEENSIQIYDNESQAKTAAGLLS
jgi:hypothetical protein